MKNDDMTNIELIKRLYEAINQGDMPTVIGSLDSRISWSEAEGNPIRPSGEP
jgi:ketosteroid isomerase-like protein